MVYTLLGILGFGCFLLFDLMSMRQRVLEKYVFLIIGVGLIVFSSIHIVLAETSWIIAEPIRYIGLALAFLFLALLVYSVFIEVGRNTYEPTAKPRLITNGTYGLVRHPGVIWMFLSYVFAALYFGNQWLLVTALVWTMINLIYIILQERLVLSKLFVNYDQYIATTPMIIPTISSVRRFMRLQNWRKE